VDVPIFVAGIGRVDLQGLGVNLSSSGGTHGIPLSTGPGLSVDALFALKKRISRAKKASAAAWRNRKARSQ
jgi:hypothetical protein